MRNKTPDLNKLLGHAARELSTYVDRAIDPSEVDVWMFPQTWPDSGLGFEGGVVLHAFWSALTSVFATQDRNTVAVYFGDRFAYGGHAPDPVFWNAVEKQQMPHQRHARRLWAMLEEEFGCDPVIYYPMQADENETDTDDHAALE